MRCRLFLLLLLLPCALPAEDPPSADEKRPRETYRNPIIDHIGPADPAVIRYRGTYYLYPTWDGKGYDVFVSEDLVRWEQKPKCYVDARGGAWAPDVFYHVRDGKFYLYYTVNDPEGGKLIGVAVADDPLGPFLDRGTLATGAIDAHMFRDDDGALYLYYVEITPPPFKILVVRMSDPLTKEGGPKEVLRPTDPWERRWGAITEGPWMVKRGGVYYLMYSGSGANSPHYAIGYATSRSPLGPFEKHPGNPIAQQGGGVFGPGHHSVVTGPRGGLWMVYHQQNSTKIGWDRFLAMDPLWFDEEGVIHVKPTRGSDEPLRHPHVGEPENLLGVSSGEGSPAAGAEWPALWFYYSTNLWVDRNVERLEEVWRRAARAGYTRVLLADSKFARLADMDERYFRNVARVKALARELEIEIVPALFSIGYSNSMLWHDPNLAEGLPVRRAPFVVRRGEAHPVSDPPVAFGDSFDWKDDVVRVEDGVAAVSDNAGNARLVENLTVARFRPYHISVRIKTENYTGRPEIKALDREGRSLTFSSLAVKSTQDWREHHAVFNSLGNDQVRVYFGVWGPAKGRLWWRDWKIEEAGLVNLLRRPGAPFEVEGYVEGEDFDPVVDPKMGTNPWKGEYDVWHEPPVIKTPLPDGTRLHVSWYHPAVIYAGQVSCCLSEPRVLDLLEDEARRVRAAWGARSYMMSHDEIRTLNRDAACRERGLDAGAILAENVRACTELLEGAEVHVWSDMFDPHHNAHRDYYLVRGDLAGSWEGLDRRVVIVNWNYGKRDASLEFFSRRGHRQVIAAYYDGPVERVENWLSSASRVRGVTGIMYTTWRSDYDDLEAFARACREYRHGGDRCGESSRSSGEETTRE